MERNAFEAIYPLRNLFNCFPSSIVLPFLMKTCLHMNIVLYPLDLLWTGLSGLFNFELTSDTIKVNSVLTSAEVNKA
jgi:hypothetical protein